MQHVLEYKNIYRQFNFILYFHQDVDEAEDTKKSSVPNETVEELYALKDREDIRIRDIVRWPELQYE